LSTVVAVLPSLRFCVEYLLSSLRNLAGEGPGLFHGLIVIGLRLGDSPRKWSDLPVECGDGGIDRTFGRKTLRTQRLL